MKLDDVQSKQLLPRFADDVEWIQQAFDVIVKHANERAKSIDAPLSMEAIQALTDEELQALYEQYGIAIYYPDLSRETREKMLFEMCVIYRYLGTPKAIETLCNYIFDGVELNVKVVDNQAFDENGQLVNPSMLDTFDIEIDPQIPVLDTNAHARLLENIIHFSRNSQGLNGINYDFPENFDLSVALGVSGANPLCVVDYINDAICEPVPIPPVFGEPIGGDMSSTTDNVIRVDFGPGLVSRGGYAYQDGNLLGMQWDLGGDVEEYTPPIVIPTLTLDLYLSSDKQARTFSANDYWYSYFESVEDRQAALDFGLPAFGSEQLQLGQFSEGFEIQILALLDANHDVILSDTSNFYLSFMSNENGAWAIIKSIAAYSTPTVFWRLKITKPDVLTGYYKPDDSQYFYWDDRRSIKIYYDKYDYDDYDVRTCVKATEYLDPRWADQPGYGDGTREIDPSKVSLQTYTPSDMAIMPSLNDVTIWSYSVVVIEYTLCKEMYLYRYETETGWTGPDYYYQENVTKSFTGTKQDWALGLLRTKDQGGGTTVAWDDSKRYELGSYNSSKEWVPYSVQSLSDMPDTIAGSLGEATLGYLLINLNGYLGIWFVSNYTSAVSNSMKTFRLRIYNK